MATVKEFKPSVYCLCIIISFFIDITLINSEKALIVNEDRKIFDEIPEKAGQYYFACPAEKQHEIQFNDSESISKNSLFLRHASQITEDMQKNGEIVNTPLKDCKDIYKPSILVQLNPMQFEIGFEIYSNNPSRSEAQELKSKYSSIAEFSPGKSGSKVQKKNNKMKDSDAVEIRKLDASIELDKPLLFHWIPIYHFDFDREQYDPKQIVYSGDLGKYDGAFKCPQYAVDKDLYGLTNLTLLYTYKKQVKIFSFLPGFPYITTTVRSTGEVSPYNCGLFGPCLKQHQVIPHYYYHSQASKLGTCFAVNTLPVWETISEENLRKVELYLYVITQIWGPNITITTGTSGVLSFPRKETIFHEKIPFLRKPLYMDPKNKKVPVPEIIYKIVEYKKSAEEQYYLIIVTHNETKSSKVSRICKPTSKDVDYQEFVDSWKFLKNEDSKSGFTYVCPMTTQVLSKLKVHRSKSKKEKFPPLLLEHFSLTGEEGVEMTDKEKITMIYKKVENLDFQTENL